MVGVNSEFTQKALLHQLVDFIELTAHVEVQVDAVEGGAPLLLLVGGQLAVTLHIGAGLLVSQLQLLLLTERVQLKCFIQVGGAGVVIRVGHRVVAGDERVAQGDALVVTAHVEKDGRLGVQIEHAAVVDLKGAVDDIQGFGVVAPCRVVVHQARKEIAVSGITAEALAQGFHIERVVVQLSACLAHVLQGYSALAVSRRAKWR